MRGKKRPNQRLVSNAREIAERRSKVWRSRTIGGRIASFDYGRPTERKVQPSFDLRIPTVMRYRRYLLPGEALIPSKSRIISLQGMLDELSNSGMIKLRAVPSRGDKKKLEKRASLTPFGRMTAELNSFLMGESPLTKLSPDESLILKRRLILVTLYGMVSADPKRITRQKAPSREEVFEELAGLSKVSRQMNDYFDRRYGHDHQKWPRGVREYGYFLARRDGLAARSREVLTERFYQRLLREIFKG